MVKVGTKGKLTFKDKTTAKVFVVDIENLAGQKHYWLSYCEGETNQKIIHPDFEGRFPIPQSIMDMVFTKTEE